MPLLVQFPTLIQLFSFSFLVFSNRIHWASSNISPLLHSPLNYLWSSGKYEELPPPSCSVSGTYVNYFPGGQGARGMETAFAGLRRLQGMWGCMSGLRVSRSIRLFLSIAVWHFSSTHKVWPKMGSQLQWLVHLGIMGDVVFPSNSLHWDTQPEQKLK